MRGRQERTEEFRFHRRNQSRELISKGEWTKLSLKGVSQYNPERWVGLIGGLTLQQVSQVPEANTFEIRPFRRGLIDLFVFGNVRVMIRSLVEFRLIRSADEGAFQSDWRWRNRLGVRIPITEQYFINKTLYGIVDIEAFADLTGTLSDTFAGRLGWRAELGYIFTGFWRIKLIYTLQSSRSTATQDFETSDHIVRICVRQTIKAPCQPNSCRLLMSSAFIRSFGTRMASRSSNYTRHGRESYGASSQVRCFGDVRSGALGISQIVWTEY